MAEVWKKAKGGISIQTVLSTLYGRAEAAKKRFSTETHIVSV